MLSPELTFTNPKGAILPPLLNSALISNSVGVEVWLALLTDIELILETVSDELLLATDDDVELRLLESAEVFIDELAMEESALEEIATALVADELAIETGEELPLPPQAVNALGKAHKIIFTILDLIVVTSIFWHLNIHICHSQFTTPSTI